MTTINIGESTLKDVVANNQIVFIDWWADWCGPCKAFAPTYEAASEKHPEIVFAKVDTEAEQSLAASAQITSIPTLMAFRDGILLFSQAGALPPKALDELVDAIKTVNMDDVKAEIAKQQADNK